MARSKVEDAASAGKAATESLEKNESSTAPAKRKQRLSQADVPGASIAEALRVPIALRDEYGKEPTRPLGVAMALKMTPTGSTFRKFTGAAVAYGLTEGAAQGESIALTALGRRAVAPTEEGDDRRALAEAVLKPRVVREFLEKYDGSRVPSRSIAANVLEDMGVPSDATERALDMILDNARAVGFLKVINGQDYVDLNGSSPIDVPRNVDAPTPEDSSAGTGASESLPVHAATTAAAPPLPPAPMSSTTNDLKTNKRVFVSHGKNTGIVDQLKEVLTFGGFEPVVSIENESVSKPVPDKVMDDMRSCGAGIVHVGAEKKVIDSDGAEHNMLNQNVLIEIGGALALYRRNFILLVEKGVTLPSNLQGLYEVRYDGDKLDYEATMKLLRAFNDFKTSTYDD